MSTQKAEHAPVMSPIPADPKASNEPLLEIRNMLICQGEPQGGFWVELPELLLRPKQRWLITGESGSGKSTLLEALGLIKQADSVDRFLWHKRAASADLKQLWDQGRHDTLTRLRAENIGFVLQSGELLPFLNIEENIRLPLAAASRRIDENALATVLQELGLTPLLQHKPGQLSLGERQRAAFVRAIVHAPDLLLADEPTASLDQGNAGRLLAAMLTLQQQTGVCLVLVTHNASLVDWPGLQRLHAEPRCKPGRMGSRFVC